MGIAPAPAAAMALRLADVLGALSLATDLANGQPSEHGLRTALLATRLAQDEPQGTRQDVFWAGLLRYLGCSGFAVEEAHFAAGDDIGLRESFARTDMGRPTQFVGAVLRDLGKGAPLGRRIRSVAGLLASPGAPRAHAHAQCEAALHCGGKLGMTPGVLRALAQSDERYDGRGLPDGLRGHELALPLRYVEVARVAVIFHGLGGSSAAAAEVSSRAGGHLDPDIARRFAAQAAHWCRGLEQTSVWEEYLASEPGLWLLGEQALQPLFEAFALMADLKSGYFCGHSTGVSALAQAAAKHRGLAAEESALLGRAALLHDLGRVAVPTGLWDKPGPLTPAEWERVHLHSYYTDRVLRRSPTLARYADIAGRAHERLDGSGYHRGDRDISQLVRLLAAADTYQACTEARAFRPALSARDARQALLDGAAQGRLCRDAVDAVLAATGQDGGPPTIAAHDLTPRELDVLKLMVRGLSNKQIGQQLAISPRTVQHHTIHIYDKAGMKSRAGAALWAIERGVFTRPH